MFAIIIGLIVIALVVTLLLKGYYPQAILFILKVVQNRHDTQVKMTF